MAEPVDPDGPNPFQKFSEPASPEANPFARFAAPKPVENPFARFAPAREERPVTPNTGIVGDLGSAVTAGWGSLVGGAGQVAGWLGADETKKSLQKYGKETEEHAMKELTPESKAASELPWVVDPKPGETGYLFGKRLGPAVTSPRALALATAQSIPASLATIPATLAAPYLLPEAAVVGAGTIGASVLARFGIAIGKDAIPKLGAHIAGAIMSGGAEGFVQAGMTGEQVEQSILAMSPELVSKSPLYPKYLEQSGGDPAKAQAAIARHLANEASVQTGVATAAAGAPMGAVFGAATRGHGAGKLGTAAKGVFGEAGQEAIQNPADQYIQNVAERQVDPSIPLSRKLVEQGVQGAWVGAGMGGLHGGAAGALGQARQILAPPDALGVLKNMGEGKPAETPRPVDAPPAAPAVAPGELPPGLTPVRDPVSGEIQGYNEAGGGYRDADEVHAAMAARAVPPAQPAQPAPPASTAPPGPIGEQREPGEATSMPVVDPKALRLLGEQQQLQQQHKELGEFVSNLEVSKDAPAAREKLVRVTAIQNELQNPQLEFAQRQQLQRRLDELLTNTSPETLQEMAAPLEMRRQAVEQQQRIAERLKEIEGALAQAPIDTALSPLPKPAPAEQTAEPADSPIPEHPVPEEPPAQQTPPEQIARTFETLRTALNNLGLPNVGLALQEKISAVAEGKASEADGRYLNSLIQIALDNAAGQPGMLVALNHEALHAMRDLGLFTDAEWRILSKNKAVQARIPEIVSRYRDRPTPIPISAEAVIEEAVADQMAAWATSPPPGLLGRIYNKAVNFVQALGNALRGSGFTSAGSLAGQFRSGAIGARQATQPAAAQPRLKLRPARPAEDEMPKVPGRDGLTNPLKVPADALEKLTRKLKRGTQGRSGVGAPKQKTAVKLPNGVHVGQVNISQWIARVEHVLTSDEIEAARVWYEDALPAYEKYFGKEQAPAMMGAWLMANQNATPGFAQLSAVRALEQYTGNTRDKPGSLKAGLAHDKLAQYWDAIQSGDLSKLGDISTGQKIYDFIDSSIQKNTRTFYGDDPRAGAPAVADVHSFRDTGTIDDIMLQWVRNQFGDKVANRLVSDGPTAGKKEATYEWAADRMRAWTDELNAQKYLGRDDWKPHQVQAVGWMAMSKMLGRPGMTAESSISSNIRNLSYELDPGAGAPFNETFPEFANLSPDAKTRVSDAVLPRIVEIAKQITGATEFARVKGLGGWHEFTNPSFKSRLIASPEVAGDVADIVGYLAQQTKVFGYRWVGYGKKVGVAIYGDGLQDSAIVGKLWDRVVEKHPDLAAGFSPSIDANGTHGIEILLDRGGDATLKRVNREMVPTIDAFAKEAGIAVDIGSFRAAEESREHDWQKDSTGGSYLSRLDSRYGPEIRDRLELHRRQEVEPAIRDAIDAERGDAADAGRAADEPAGKLSLRANPEEADRPLAAPVPLGRLDAGPETQADVYSRFGHLEPGTDTTPQLKVYNLDPLISDPAKIDSLLDRYGYRVRYFAYHSDPDAGVEFRLPKLKRDGYGQGTLWLYDPRVAAGSFKDTAYTDAWRRTHELGHAISEQFVQQKYGPSHREGRLGQPSETTRGVPPKQVKIEVRPLTLDEAQRAIEWEDIAFRTQRQLLQEAGVEISDAEFAHEYNINLGDATYRILTSHFGDPGEYGFLPSSTPADLRGVLDLLQRAETQLAEQQGREPTTGVDLETWQRVSDDEIRQALDQAAESPRAGKASDGEHINEAGEKFSLRQAAEMTGETEQKFRDWFHNSKVVDDTGAPKVMYHGTLAGGFERFRRRPVDIGLHFGTVGQANDILKQRAHHKGSSDGATVVPVFLSIQKPLRLPDLGRWTRDNVGNALARLEEFRYDRPFSKGLVELRALLRSKGYDGIVYKNTGESDGLNELYQEERRLFSEAQKEVGFKNSVSVEQQKHPAYLRYKEVYDRRWELANRGEDSYIAFEPTQIKSVFNTEFNERDPKFSLRQAAASAEETEEKFKAWFSGSKVVDAHGKPQVVYHGTSKDAPFTKFKPSRRGTWFSDKPEIASSYAETNDSQGYDFYERRPKNTASRVIPAYLSIKNPYAPTDADIQRYRVSENYQRAERAMFDDARRAGHDGVMLGDPDHRVWVTFQPNQIKSVFNTEFNAKDPKFALRKAAAETDETEQKFTHWFRKSKVVDADGAPQTVYHGTLTWDHEGRSLGQFEAFDRMASVNVVRRPQGMDTVGSWFSDNPGEKSGASMYASSEGAVYPVYLSIQKPWRPRSFDQFLNVMHKVAGRDPRKQNPKGRGSTEEMRKWLVDNGYDGIMFRKGTDPEFSDQNVWVALEPNQIKSIFNTEFDPSDERFSLRRDDVMALDEIEQATGDKVSLAAMDKARGPLWSMRSTSVQGTPDQEAIIERVLKFHEKVPLGQRIREAWQEVKTNGVARFRQGMLDRLDAVAQLEKSQNQGELLDAQVSAYKAMRMTSNLSSVMHVLLKKGMIAHQNGEFVPVAGFEGGFEGIFKPLAESGKLRLWQAWAVANRANRLIREGRENLMSQDDIDKLLPLGVENPEFARTLAKYQAFNQRILDLAVQTGLINGELRAQLRANDYVPFYRVLDRDGSDVGGPGVKGGVSGQSAGIRQLRGGDALINDLFHNMTRNMSRLVDASFKNMAAVRTIDLALSAGAVTKRPMDFKPVHFTATELQDALDDINIGSDVIPAAQKDLAIKLFTMVQPKDGNVVSIKRNGKSEYYTVEDPLLLAAFGPAHIKQNGLVMFGGRFSNLLRRGITTLPDFMTANFIRDTLSAWVVSGGKTNPLTAVSGFVSSLKDSVEANEIAAAGGGGKGFYGNHPQDVAEQMSESIGGSTKSRLHRAFEAWERIGQASEQANRIAVYKSLKKAGASNAEAAYQAVDLLDFSMRGDFAAMRAITTLVPFLNARVQGIYKLWRSGKENPTGFWLRGAAIMLPSIALTMANIGQDWYDELSPDDRELYYHFKVGGQHIRLPKPFEVGAIFSTAPEILVNAWYNTEYGHHTIQRAGAVLMDQFNFNPTPQIIKPMVDQVMNKQGLVGGRPIVSHHFENLPDAQQYTARTSALAKMVGQATDVSPLRLDALLSGYFGSFGSMLGAVTTGVANSLSSTPTPTKRVEQLPLIGRYVRDEPALSTQWANSWYSLVSDAQKITRGAKAYQDIGESKAAEQLIKDNPGSQWIAHRATQVSKQLAAMARQEQRIQIDPKMSSDEKRKQLDALMTQRNLIQRQSVEQARIAMERRP